MSDDERPRSDENPPSPGGRHRKPDEPRPPVQPPVEQPGGGRPPGRPSPRPGAQQGPPQNGPIPNGPTPNGRTPNGQAQNGPNRPVQNGPVHPGFGPTGPAGPVPMNSRPPVNGRSPVNGRPVGLPGRPLPPRRPVAAASGAPGFGPDDAPPDLMAVQADDALINALSRGVSVPSGGGGGHDPDDRFVAMLAAWKAEVDAEPIPELVDVDTAMAAIRSGVAASAPARRNRRARHLVPLAGAAALIVFAVTGVSLGAHSAQPGDTLFGVTEVLYKETAQSRQAATDAQAGIEQVAAALRTGDTAGAAQQLTEVEQLMAKVKPEDGAPELVATQRFLSAKLQETPSGTPTDPNAPLRDGTPRPKPPAIPGTPSRPTSPTSSTSIPATSAVPTTSPVAEPPVTSVPSTTTAPPSATPRPTSEGSPDSSTTGLGGGTPAPGATAAGSPATGPEPARLN